MPAPPVKPAAVHGHFGSFAFSGPCSVRTEYTVLFHRFVCPPVPQLQLLSQQVLSSQRPSLSPPWSPSLGYLSHTGILPSTHPAPPPPGPQLFFPQIFDIKYLMKFCDNLHGGLNKLAETLDVARIGPQHQVCFSGVTPAANKLVQCSSV